MFEGRWFGDFGKIFGDDARAFARAFARRSRARFGRGDLRYLILSMLGERPMHGYEIMRKLEHSVGGRYTASPGTVYPTLQMLEDMGYVTSAQADGKRVYTITEAGRAFLVEQQERVKDSWDRAGERHQRGGAGESPWFDVEAEFEAGGGEARPEERRRLKREMGLFITALGLMTQDATPEEVKRLREVLVRSRREMEDIMREPVER